MTVVVPFLLGISTSYNKQERLERLTRTHPAIHFWVCLAGEDYVRLNPTRNVMKNTPSFALQQNPATNGMRSQHEQRLAAGQQKQGFPAGSRNYRPRPNQPRYGTSTQETNLSRSTTRTSEGELAPVNEAALEGLRNYHKEEQTIRNDLAIRYTVSGEWGGNHIKGASPEETCRE